jgi:hypothetical protein
MNPVLRVITCGRWGLQQGADFIGLVRLPIVVLYLVSLFQGAVVTVIMLSFSRIEIPLYLPSFSPPPPPF